MLFTELINSLKSTFSGKHVQKLVQKLSSQLWSLDTLQCQSAC